MKTFKDLTDEHEIFRWTDNDNVMSYRILYNGTIAAYENQETLFLETTNLWGSRLRIPSPIAELIANMSRGQVSL